MAWNWEQRGWPNFSYDSAVLEPLERELLRRAGEFVGTYKHVGPEDRDNLKIELLSEDAVKTSAIEGEILDRDSVQSSLRHEFGLGAERAGIRPAERGISRMLADLLQNFAAPLDAETLFRWHAMLMSGSRTLDRIGSYRTSNEPMQVVSGPDYKRKVHFEAPPSARVPDEMHQFIVWFNATAAGERNTLPALTRAAHSHLYFECIHPFEDGNGRIGRALSEKALAQSLREPTLIALSYTIERKRKDYYAALERNNKDLDVTDWMTYFANTILEAQANTISRVEFYVAKAKFYQRYRDNLNERQAKVVARMFREGFDGFEGGLSAENYISITQTSRATATRDLQNLVAIGALTKTGELRHTRYALNLAMP